MGGKIRSFLHVFLRHIIFAICLIIFQTDLIFAQAWQWQNPLPQGNTLQQIQFVNTKYGWISSSATLLKTTDGGINWREIIIGRQWIEKFFFLDSANGWCAGANAPPFLLRTTDGGLNWKDVPIPDVLKSGYWHIFDVFFIDSLKGYLASEVGMMFYTSDGGSTWNQFDIIPPYDNRDIKSLFFRDSLTGFAIGDTPLLKTTDGGTNWTRDSSLFSINGANRRIFFIDSVYGWILCYDKVFRTTDKGNTWTGYMISDELTHDDQAIDMVFIDHRQGWVSTGKGLFNTRDSGKTWININPDVLFQGIYFKNELEGFATGRTREPQLYNVTNKYFYTSDGGYTWQTNYTSATDQLMYTIDFADENNGWAAGSSGSIIHTSDGGKTWIPQFSTAGHWLRNVEFWNKDLGWIVGLEGLYLRTINGGQTWERRVINRDYYLESTCFISPQEGWAVGWSSSADTGVVLKITNSGLGWINMTPPGVKRLYGVFFTDSQTGFIASGGGTVEDIGEVYKTTDGGKTWILNLWDSDVRFEDILFVDSLTGWVSSNNGLYKTTDGGNNWEHHQVFNDFDYIYSFTFINKSRGWANGQQGRFAWTTDGGETWSPEPLRTTFTMWGISFVNENTGWLAGDFGIILHTTNGGITSIVTNENFVIQPNNFELYQNYPNPFNSGTVINYSLNKEGLVSLKIYNILGEEVQTIVNNFQDKGSHSINFDNKNIPSGTYIYTLRFDGKQISHKMLLLK